MKNDHVQPRMKKVAGVWQYAEGCDDSRPAPLAYHALIVVPRGDNLAKIVVHHDISRAQRSGA